jgi:DedD protein
MQEKNELSDIVLNKSESANSNKKTILAVATLGVVLIVVILLMKPSSSSENNLVQPVPPKPQQGELIAEKTEPLEAKNDELTQEPLFEDVEVIQEEPTTVDEDLDKIAQKLKQESQEQTVTTALPTKKKHTKTVTQETKKSVVKVASKHQNNVKTVKKAVNGKYYVQVGSFSKYEPNKKFLNSITKLGYKYKYHKVGSLNKVIVGPFQTKKEANHAKKVLRSKVEPGAFIVEL